MITKIKSTYGLTLRRGCEPPHPGRPLGPLLPRCGGEGEKNQDHLGHFDGKAVKMAQI